MKFLFLLLLLLSFLQSVLADTFHPLSSAKQALQARVDLIQNAQRSIDITYFIWNNDRTGNELLALLREAAKRGVKVRMIVDSMFNEIPKQTRVHLKEVGVELEDFNPFQLFNSKSWANRIHSKLLLVDGETLLMGGRNITDGYFEVSKNKWKMDRDVIVRGEAVESVQGFFNELWEQKHVRPKVKKVSRKKVEEAGQTLDQALLSLKKHPYLKLDTNNQWKGKEVHNVEVIVGNSELQRKKKEDEIFERFEELALAATDFILIENPYVMPQPKLINLIKEVRRRGVRVRLFTNSLRSTNSIHVASAYLPMRKKLVKMGVELYEHKGEEKSFLHSKSAVIDDRWALIGSYNFDYLSSLRNLEALAIVEDPETAMNLRNEMDESLKDGYRVTLEKAAKGPKPPEASLAKKIKTQLLRFTLTPIFKTFF